MISNIDLNRLIGLLRKIERGDIPSKLTIRWALAYLNELKAKNEITKRNAIISKEKNI